MNILANSLLLFAIAMAVHLVWWKIRVPKRQTATLLVLFTAVLLGGAWGLTHDRLRLGVLGLPALAGALDVLQVASFFVASMLAYIVIYSALAADSPSLVMIRQIAEAGGGGLSREKLLERANAAVLIDPRLADLVTDRVADFDGRHYQLRPKGVRLARLIIFYREVLMRRREKGG